MEERKLNFNVPLLSTRRMQKTAAVSVRRNKSNNFTDFDSKTSECPPVPVLVPDDEVTEPASVPFTWEQAPGRLKGNGFRPQVCVLTQEKDQVFIPCLPPGKAVDGNMTRLQSSKGKQVEESDDDEDDVFSDALDTLSPKDSFSFNNSISGVSEYGGVETKKPLDAQSRDFMMSRFLPAAKAMTVEQPHYASSRKPSTFMPEPMIQMRELVPGDKQQTPNRYDESYYYHQDIDDDEGGADDKDDEVSEYAYLSKKGCGMLPQLCFKDSIGMLNTVSGFKAKHNSPITSPSHDQVKSSKVAQLKYRFQSVKKLALDSVSKHKLGGKVQSPVHPSFGKKFNSESNFISAANRSSSPYRHTRCMSPFRSTGNSSPFHPAGFPETRKETENLRANRLSKHTRNISRTSQELLYPKSNGSTSSRLEKTVYVDTENFPMSNDQHNSNVMVFPEEADMERKPDANPDLEAFENISIRSGEMVKGNELVEISNGLDQSLLAPPSPKRPSESWLCHNLPSVTSKIPSRRYHPFNPQKQDLTENYRNVTKWETIVKTSYMHRDHIRYSEELVAHTSHQSKT
ncbi:hypothetical protein ISN45_Aa01g020790 [Arabidopsis thaliana x Arabidopsis arenosa]|uniref:Uncharacterized protein n=1 Tax=Arabidopsis thaliana x Arabidopsis arenosa TaxID=1240361 RepID=A0A8T2CD95_9BRAS|nr:hypothetical protein ISN45_Aa01g020790 [Arabidopsis thaliana x Arabidopsis arenosa]